MKKVRKVFKNALNVNRLKLEKLVNKVNYNPKTTNELESIVKPYLDSLHLLNLDKLTESGTIGDMIYSPFDKINLDGLTDAFVDRVSWAFEVPREGVQDKLHIDPVPNANSLNQVISSLDKKTSETGVLNRNIVISLTNVLAKDVRGKYNYAPDVQIMIYDGLLFSPSGNILFMEKVLGVTKVTLVKKIPVYMNAFNIVKYELDSDSNIISVDFRNNLKVRKKMLKDIFEDGTFTTTDLEDKLIKWYNFKPQKGVIQNGKKKTTEDMGYQL